MLDLSNGKGLALMPVSIHWIVAVVVVAAAAVVVVAEPSKWTVAPGV